MNKNRENLKLFFPSEYPCGMIGRCLADGDMSPEVRMMLCDFERVCWVDVSSDFWYGRESAIHFFSSEACIYYLPSVIASSYEDFDGIGLVSSSIINDWTPRRDEGLEQRRNRRWGRLSEIQRGFAAAWAIEMKRLGLATISDSVLTNALKFLAAPNSGNQPH